MVSFFVLFQSKYIQIKRFNLCVYINCVYCSVFFIDSTKSNGLFKLIQDSKTFNQNDAGTQLKDQIPIQLLAVYACVSSSNGTNLKTKRITKMNQNIHIFVR